MTVSASSRTNLEADISPHSNDTESKETERSCLLMIHTRQSLTGELVKALSAAFCSQRIVQPTPGSCVCVVTL